MREGQGQILDKQRRFLKSQGWPPERIDEHIRQQESATDFKAGFKEFDAIASNMLRRKGLDEEVIRVALETGEIPDPLASIYTGWAGEFSRVYAEATEIPRSFLFISALTALGSLVGDRVTLRSEIRPQGRLYTLLLGESADDRKSSALKVVVDFFKASMREFPVCRGVGSAEGLAVRFKDDNKLLLCLDEFKTFVSKTKIESSTLLQVVNTLFEDNIFESYTVKRRIELHDVHLSLLAASTVNTYSGIYDQHFLDLGFNNRVFIVKDSSEPRFSLPDEIEEPTKKPLQLGLHRILEHSVFIRRLKLTEGAKELFQKWYMELRAKKMQAAKRLDTYAHRFMILFSVNDSKDEVDLETVQKVITLMDYELKLRNECDPIDADNKIAAMEERLRRIIQTGPADIQTLKKRAHYERSGLWVFDTAMKNLQKGREMVWDKEIKAFRGV